MAIYSIKVLLPTRCIRFSGLFKDRDEAQTQTLADYPEARVISVFFIREQA